MIVPNQVRSVDPWCEHRFTTGLNRRIRIFTGGKKNSILYNESFKLTNPDGNIHKIEVSPGLAIVDDVVLHVLDSSIFDFTQNLSNIKKYYINEDMPQNKDVFFTHVFLKYKYELSEVPPVSATYYLSKTVDITKYGFSKDIMLWLGYFKVDKTILNDVTSFVCIPIESNIFTEIWKDGDISLDYSLLTANDPDVQIVQVERTIYSPATGLESLDGGQCECV